MTTQFDCRIRPGLAHGDTAQAVREEREACALTVLGLKRPPNSLMVPREHHAFDEAARAIRSRSTNDIGPPLREQLEALARWHVEEGNRHADLDPSAEKEEGHMARLARGIHFDAALRLRKALGT